uniref:Heteromeric transposase endonuclease subunit TnsA n=1 Tax=mine drainage metagenome TaxID=410659 RepID=E6QNS8_9ZZZZ
MTGIAASSKSGGAAQFESTLERDFLSLLEFSPEVKNIEPQPVKIDWSDAQGGHRSYTPDVLVEFIEASGKRPWLCEVKYRSELLEKWVELRPKFKAALHFAKEHGWRFKIVTEREIRTPHLANVRFLTSYRRTIPDAGVMQDILGHLNKIHEATPRDLIEAIRPDITGQTQMISVLWHLVATFQIGADLLEPLTMKSRIWSLS